jgi:hypothetical protein
VPLATEVNAFQREVRGDKSFVACRDIEDSAIVADSVKHARKHASAIG